MNEVILEKTSNVEGSENESRNELPVGSQAKAERNPKIKRKRKPLTEDEFNSIIQELRKEGMSITADFAVLKNVALQERRKEAEKPLYLARYE
jgi:hypothetical protein